MEGQSKHARDHYCPFWTHANSWWDPKKSLHLRHLVHLMAQLNQNCPLKFLTQIQKRIDFWRQLKSFGPVAWKLSSFLSFAQCTFLPLSNCCHWQVWSFCVGDNIFKSSPYLLIFVDKIDANDVVEIETGECSCGAKKGSKIVGGEEASVSF